MALQIALNDDAGGQTCLLHGDHTSEGLLTDIDFRAGPGALCLDPKVMLLDEPSEGLMPGIVDKLMDTIAGLKADGVAVLLVEQKVEAALEVADRIAFLENGRVRHAATPQELTADPQPLHRYVGVRRERSGS